MSWEYTEAPCPRVQEAPWLWTATTDMSAKPVVSRSDHGFVECDVGWRRQRAVGWWEEEDSLKITWQNQPEKVLQSSLLYSAGVHLERKNPEVSWGSFSCLFWFSGSLLGSLQIHVTSCTKAANKVNSEFCLFRVGYSGNTDLPQKRILEYQSDTWWTNQLFTAVLSISLFHCLQKQWSDRGLRELNDEKIETQVPSSLVLFVKPK